ncbi:MAG: hypothetical protein M3328_18770, partial [Chloroflexota bacterium]|nr:hypothetical protein [Chloroflexota bacterium]
WNRATNPSVPARNNVLAGVSASGPDDIWAVGYSSAPDGVKTLAMHFDGKEWKIVPTPNPAAGDNFLDGVAAIGPRDAWAVGDSGTPEKPGAILMHWDGNFWANVPIPPFQGSDAALYAVTATGPNDVWAIGEMGNNRDSTAVVLHYDGANWTLSYTMGGGHVSSIFYGVAARSPNDVWAVGAQEVPGNVRDLQVHWDGTSWDTATLGEYRMRAAYDIALSPTSDARWTVGTNGADVAIIHVAGGTKESTGDELKKGNTNALLGAVGVSDTEAWAVGYGESDRRRTPIITFTTDGTNWQPAPVPGTNGSAELIDIAAVPGVQGSFVAVGSDAGQALIDVSVDPCAPQSQPQPTATATGAPVSTATGVGATASTPTPYPTYAPTPIPGENNSGQQFPETGKTVKGVFLDYWQQNGGLAQQGYPISEMFTEISPLNGKAYTVQYFERAVFEYHPENQAPYNVLLSQLGTFQYKQKYPNGAPNQKPNTSAGSQLFPETGKVVGGKFLDYWKSHGGLAQQGFPISEEFVEKSDLNGKEYLVQYFERAVFEFHPENQPPYDVLLSQLGTFQYRQKYGGK